MHGVNNIKFILTDFEKKYYIEEVVTCCVMYYRGTSRYGNFMQLPRFDPWFLRSSISQFISSVITKPIFNSTALQLHFIIVSFFNNSSY